MTKEDFEDRRECNREGCREFLIAHGLSLDLLDLINTDSYSRFTEAVNKLRAKGAPPTNNERLRAVFGLNRKDK